MEQEQEQLRAPDLMQGIGRLRIRGASNNPTLLNETLSLEIPLVEAVNTWGSVSSLSDHTGLANDRGIPSRFQQKEPVCTPLKRALLNTHRVRTGSDSDTHRVRTGSDSDTTRGRTTRRAYRRRTHSLNLGKEIVGQKKITEIFKIQLEGIKGGDMGEKEGPAPM